MITQCSAIMQCGLHNCSKKSSGRFSAAALKVRIMEKNYVCSINYKILELITQLTSGSVENRAGYFYGFKRSVYPYVDALNPG